MKGIAILFPLILLGAAHINEDFHASDEAEKEELVDLLTNHATTHEIPEEIVHHTMETSPGTKWCGEQSTADNDDDFGEYAQTDRCCKDHRSCKQILGGETKFELENTNEFIV